MTTPISTSSATGFAAELATLLIENETNQEDSNRMARDAARNAFLADAQKQVDALHAAAAAGEQGALAGAAFSIAGAGCSIGAAGYNYDAGVSGPKTSEGMSDMYSANDLQAVGKGFSDLSGVANSACGGRQSADDTADAKHFETLAAEAKWQADDASTEIDKADKLGDKIMDIVQSLNQDQNTAANAVIGRI
jgi:hypothetical protein